MFYMGPSSPTALLFSCRLLPSNHHNESNHPLTSANLGGGGSCSILAFFLPFQRNTHSSSFCLFSAPVPQTFFDDPMQANIAAATPFYPLTEFFFTAVTCYACFLLVPIIYKSHSTPKRKDLVKHPNDQV